MHGENGKGSSVAGSTQGLAKLNEVAADKVASFLPDSAAAAAAAAGATKAKAPVRCIAYPHLEASCSDRPACLNSVEHSLLHARRPAPTLAAAASRLPAAAQPPLPPAPPQAKSFAVRKWLAVNPQGEVRHLELAKMRVTAGLGVQLRDLRWVLAPCPAAAGSRPACCSAARGLVVLARVVWGCSTARDGGPAADTVSCRRACRPSRRSQAARPAAFHFLPLRHPGA